MVDTRSSLRGLCDLRVTVFERRQGATLYWHTLGLGELDRFERGPSALKLQQRIVQHLRRAIAKLWPAQLEALEFVPGRTLHGVELDMLLGEPRRRVRGRFSLVLEPRDRGGTDDAPLWIAYHPLRPHEWFPHAPERTLADEASSYFRQRWSSLDPLAIEQLRASPRETLRLFSFTATSRGLLELVDDRPGAEDRPALGANPRQRGAALLAELGRNETELIAEGDAPLGAERSPWTQQLRQLLCGDQRSSVLLVGPSGCGKSTLLRRAIHDRLEADGWAVHRNLDQVHAVWSIRGSRLIAGMSYLGQWEQRCVDLLEACRTERALLWIEDLHAWGRIGESREADRNLATFFRGPIARGELTVLAECTAEQLQLLQDDAPELAAALTTLWVDATDARETARLVHHSARRLEVDHGVGFDAAAFRTIADLGGALSPSTAEPGKSIELLHALARGEYGFSLELDLVEQEVAAGRRLHAIRRWRELSGGSLHAAVQAVDQFTATGVWPAITERVHAVASPSAYGTIDPRFDEAPPPAVVGHSAVVRLLAKRTGVPELLLVPQRPLAVDTVRTSFAEQVLGQSTAVDAVTDIVLRMRTQLDDRARPYGVLLLSGPTGTGKTELAKCVAEYLYGDPKRLIRLDMSEYGGADAVARLVGDRARPEGVLTQAVRAQPFCVVLLDEIDKADPAILGLMLQVFDDGRLTDAAGQVVDFSHAVVLLTSNLGATTERAIGLGERPEHARRELVRAVQDFFAPELFNRIDRVVPFDPLSVEGATRIAHRELQQLLTRDGLVERNVFVRFTPAVIDFVVARGFAARDGARSLKRWLEDHVGAWLADEIAGGPLAAMRVFWLYVRDGQLALHGEHLIEATWRADPGAMQLLLDRNARQLRRGLADALTSVETVLDSPALVRLGATMSEQVSRSAAGDTAAGQTAYSLDRLRGELLELRDRLRVQADYDPLLADDTRQAEVHGELVEAERFGWARRAVANDDEIVLRALDPRGQVPALPLRTRPQVLDLLDRLRLLEVAIAHADDPDEHAVLLELTRVSRTRPEGRFARPRAGLLEWLAEAYAGARVDVDERVAAFGDTIVRFDDELPDAMRGTCEQIVLRITGPGVRTRFLAEHGCHVRHALSGATEIVRVHVRPCAGVDAASFARQVVLRRQQFAAALEHGSAAQRPENPDAVPPIVREYHFDPAPSGAPAPITVEDHPLGHVLRLHVARLADVLPTLWMLRPDPQGGEGDTAP
ncbi:MAG: ATP-dependent Clp protease ATP-binding subunit [Deltaproteobacteria bacterium]|nr:ATP-dependent Clp protease ATP-binding subunit [Deltaproteobacteria bacterium]